MSKQGRFIVFEGVEGVGKTTQWKMMCEYLKEKKVPFVAIRFPDRTTETGKEINAYLQSNKPVTKEDEKKMYLLFVKNRQEAQPMIRKCLDEGKYVVCDRYSDSGVAYGAAKGLDREWCLEQEKGLIQPHMIVYLFPYDLTGSNTWFTFEPTIKERNDSKDLLQKVHAEFMTLIQPTWCHVPIHKQGIPIKSEDVHLRIIRNYFFK